MGSALYMLGSCGMVWNLHQTWPSAAKTTPKDDVTAVNDRFSPRSVGRRGKSAKALSKSPAAKVKAR
jgi:hypothetical protein